MILVDTSVWIDYFNGSCSVTAEALDQALSDSTVAIGDLILLEVLQGFRKDRDYQRACTSLMTLDQYNLLGKDMALKSADNFRSLRKKGITVRRTNDVIIATFCIEHGLPLLFSDHDFQPFVNHLGLLPAIGQN